MIDKIVNRMGFLRKLPKSLAKPLFNIFIFIDEVFWKLRMKFFMFFLSRGSSISSVLSQLENNGYAVFNQYYDEDQIDQIKRECTKLLDVLPEKEIRSKEKIDNLILENGLVIEKLKESIKIKKLDKFNNFFKNIAKNSKIKIISKVYQLTSGPLLVYNLVHDGAYKHPATFTSRGGKMIAGQPHIDMSTHSLRCALALDDIHEDNGPTVVFKKSMNMKRFKKNHTNIFLETFGFKIGDESGHNLDNKDIDYLENNSEKVKVVCKKGDLILIDLKTAHYQSILNKGQRHILWYYC